MTDERQGKPEEGNERRRFLKNAATAAWASPLILTMAAKPAGAQAMSCIPVGMECNACMGLPCCDMDGIPDGGCCCSPPSLPRCEGLCVAADSDCATPAPLPVDNLLLCYVPAPP